MKEEWRTIEGCNNLYEVSSFGNVRRMASKNCVQTRLLKFNMVRGYCIVRFSVGGVKKNHSVHRLVATAFIPNPKNKFTVNHKDANPSNNHVDNLEWATQTENIRHAWRLGRAKTNFPKPRYGERNNLSKLSDAQATEIREIYQNSNRGHRNISGIASRFGISERHVIRIGRGYMRNISFKSQ